MTKDVRERFENRFTPPDDACFCEKSETYKWGGRDVIHPFDEVWEGYQAALEDAQADTKKIKAEAVREAAANMTGIVDSDSTAEHAFDVLMGYADQLEEN